MTEDDLAVACATEASRLRSRSGALVKGYAANPLEPLAEGLEKLGLLYPRLEKLEKPLEERRLAAEARRLNHAVR